MKPSLDEYSARWKTGSVYPGMCVHALFNATALVAAVLT